MLISPAPLAMPVNTANIQTEAIQAEAVQRPKIPQPAAAADSARAKDSKEFADRNSAVKSSFDPKSSIDTEREQQESSDQEDAAAKAQNTLNATSQDPNQLSQQEVEQLNQLRNRDREVRTHEQAHAAAGGALAGAPSLDYTTGPDGKRYATSGEVSIDSSPVAGDPRATMEKLQQVQRAALAPTNPSSQDQKVAAQAASGINQAQVELNLLALQETQAKASNAKKAPASLYSEPVANKDLPNSVAARRQAAQLNQKIATSGALDVNPMVPTIEIRV